MSWSRPVSFLVPLPLTSLLLFRELGYPLVELLTCHLSLLSLFSLSFQKDVI